MDANDRKHFLDLIIELIDQQADWWNEQINALAERAGDEALTAWLDFARSASAPDMVDNAIRCFIDHVKREAMAWLESGDDHDLRQVLYTEACYQMGERHG